jgi:hypothetical protein
MIIENAPQAVIVIVSDHGFNLYGTSTLMREINMDMMEAYIVMSEIFIALRLGDEADAENNPIFKDPRNITRYLVNTYIGQNYDYILPE